MNQGHASELVILDIPAVEAKVKGEVADLIHGCAFGRKVTIKGGSDYALSRGSTVVVVTAGARQNEGESRLSLVGRNVKIFRSIIPEIVRNSPDCVLLVVSNPVDIMTYVAAKMSGFPVGRVIGSGTSLDSSRFRTIVAEKLDVDPRSVHGMILGEHGDSSVALWSALAVGGVRLRDLNPRLGTAEDPDKWADVHSDVIHAAGEIIKAKGYTNLAIGMTVAALCEAILRNEHRVLPLSVPVKGLHGILHDVYLSLPAVLGAEGVSEVLNVKLDEEELGKLRASAATIAAVQGELDLEGDAAAAAASAASAAAGGAGAGK